MRAYHTNSPEAISRILALTMIVDGHVHPSEMRAMQGAPFLKHVGVDAETFDGTLRQLCEDLLLNAVDVGAGEVAIDSRLRDALLAEIRDPLVQICLWNIMLELVWADGHVDHRETTLVRHAARFWFHDEPARVRALDEIPAM